MVEKYLYQLDIELSTRLHMLLLECCDAQAISIPHYALRIDNKHGEFDCTESVSRLNVVVPNYEALVDSSYNNHSRKSSVDGMIALSMPATPDAKQTYSSLYKFSEQFQI